MSNGVKRWLRFCVIGELPSHCQGPLPNNAGQEDLSAFLTKLDTHLFPLSPIVLVDMPWRTFYRGNP
jgi:hypothetical protein